MKKLRLLLPFIIIFILFLICASTTTDQFADQDVIIYGDSLAGCAAARTAALTAPNSKILLIAPEPAGTMLGGLATAGGENFADVKPWHGHIVTTGSFGRWYKQAGQFYNNQQMSQIIQHDLQKLPNLRILPGYDITGSTKQDNSIKNITLCQIQRQSNGVIGWRGDTLQVSGKIFIDASDDGRLAQLGGSNLSTGRQDWPAKYLTAGEQQPGGWPKEQAASLMFKVTGVSVPAVPGKIGDWEFSKDNKGSWGIAGGSDIFRQDPVVTAFNNDYGPLGFALKPINAAQNGAGSNEWWVNALLIFHVDGQAHQRDIGTKLYPKLPPGIQNTDQAWLATRNLIKTPRFLAALRRFTINDPATGRPLGFSQATPVLDSQSNPVVGAMLYIRETSHLTDNAGPRPQVRENSTFAVNPRMTQHAGSNPTTGADTTNHRERIGLGYYFMDINAYAFSDLKASGTYQWPVTRYVRPDWEQNGGEPRNPLYLPYDMLVTRHVPNLLVPGYATGASSMAWAGIRVLPNLTVLGDAAGVAAGEAILNKKTPANFTDAEVKQVQTELKKLGARLDK